MLDLNFKYEKTINYLNSDFSFNPELAIILGSGLGNFADEIKRLKSFSTDSVPGFPVSTVEGHSGKIHFAEFSNKKILLFQGRIHFYEGYAISDCILPVFIAKKMNCKKILLTNAAGGINKTFKPGNLMLATSFNGLNIKKELSKLVGLPSPEIKQNLLNFPSENFNAIIKQAAKSENVQIKTGVYHYTKGPSYETPAEIRMMEKFGSDAVGMSTVHEAILAAVYGIEVACISCITNMGAGISSARLNHKEVTETAEKVKDKFTRLVKRAIDLS